MKLFKTMIPYFLAIIIGFYLFPLILIDTGFYITLLYIYLPIICFLSALLYGFRHPFTWLFILFITLIVLPNSIFFFATYAIIYCLIIGVTSLVGNCIGLLLHRIIYKNRL